MRLVAFGFRAPEYVGAASGGSWANDEPKVSLLDNGVLVACWLRDHPMTPGSTQRVDTLVGSQFLLPGLFLMSSHFFPVGTACDDYAAPAIAPLLPRVEQQAVTPIGPKRSRYLYASGVDAAVASPELMDGLFGVLNAAFGVDKAMIEGQQVIWDHTPADRAKVFLPPDKAPAMLRRLIKRRLAEENSSSY